MVSVDANADHSDEQTMIRYAAWRIYADTRDQEIMLRREYVEQVEVIRTSWSSKEVGDCREASGCGETLSMSLLMMARPPPRGCREEAGR